MSIIWGHALCAAIAKAGGRWTPLLREGEQVGCLLGRRYARSRPAAACFALPGMLASCGGEVFEGVAAVGSAVPMPGDVLLLDGVKVRIGAVEDVQAPLYRLSLEGVCA